MDDQNPADESETSGAQGAITAESEGGKRVGKTLTDTMYKRWMAKSFTYLRK